MPPVSRHVALAALLLTAAGCSRRSDASSGVDIDASSGVDIDTCSACSEVECPEDTNACRQSELCWEPVQCMLDCGSDAACLPTCDTSRVPVPALFDLTAFLSCAARKCPEPCVPEEGSSRARPTPRVPLSTGRICTAPGERTGSCSDETLTVCKDGFWLLDPCLGCAFVTPEARCVDVRAVTLQPAGAGDGDEWVEATEDDAALVVEGDVLRAEWRLDADQVGALQYELTEGIDPARVEVSGTNDAAERVTLRTQAGDGGCVYTLGDGRLVRSRETNPNDVDGSGCWGVFESLAGEEPTTATVLRLETAVSTARETKSMSVTQVTLSP